MEFYGIKYSSISQQFVVAKVIMQGENFPVSDFPNEMAKEAIKNKVAILNDLVEKGDIIVEETGGNTFRFSGSHISEKRS